MHGGRFCADVEAFRKTANTDEVNNEGHSRHQL